MKLLLSLFLGLFLYTSCITPKKFNSYGRENRDVSSKLCAELYPVDTTRIDTNIVVISPGQINVDSLTAINRIEILDSIFRFNEVYPPDSLNKVFDDILNTGYRLGISYAEDYFNKNPIVKQVTVTKIVKDSAAMEVKNQEIIQLRKTETVLKVNNDKLEEKSQSLEKEVTRLKKKVFNIIGVIISVVALVLLIVFWEPISTFAGGIFKIIRKLIFKI